MIPAYILEAERNALDATTRDRIARTWDRALTPLVDALLDVADAARGINPRTGRPFHVAPWYARALARIVRRDR